MTHKTIMEYYPRNKTLVGDFVEIDDLCGHVEEIKEWEDAQFFRGLGPNEIPIVYYDDRDEGFHHFCFCYEVVVAYITFDDSDDFFLGLQRYEDSYMPQRTNIKFFNPFNKNNEQEIIVANTRSFEDFSKAVKETLMEKVGIPENQIFTNWNEMCRFIVEGDFQDDPI